MTLAAATAPSPRPSADADRGSARGGPAAWRVYAVRRLLTGVGTLVFVLVFNFFLFRLLPGDPVALYTRGRNIDQDQLARAARGSSTSRSASSSSTT